MSKIGMTTNTAQEVEVPDSSIEEQLNILHDHLDMLDDKMGLLKDNLSDVLCPVSELGSLQGLNAVTETPIMSLTAERIFTAQMRVKELLLFIDWLNENINIKHPSLMKEGGK